MQGSQERSGGRTMFDTTVRFRAANGATVSVSVSLPAAGDDTGQALAIAREAVAQVAAAQSRGPGSRLARAVEPESDDAAFWSWARPDGWRRP